MDIRTFASFGEFAAFMRRTPMFERRAEFIARQSAAGYFAREMRKRIGHEDRLPPPLADSTQAEREKLGFSANETLLRTGELRDSITFDHPSPRTTIVGSTSPIAPFHEIGTRHIPKRSFIAATVAEKESMAFELFVKVFKGAFKPR